jgi:amino acid transporter
MQGPSFLYAWVAGAVLCFLDAMIWSQLGSTYPKAGGSYNFLKEGFGPKWGKLMSFLFIWQTMLQAPLVIASASIGFSQYFDFLIPVSEYAKKGISGLIVVLIVILLYRKIETIGKISVLLWVVLLGTMAWIIGGGILHGHFLQPLKNINKGLHLNQAFIVALGFASIKTVYSYLGYFNACHLGGEITNPQKNIPRSMLISIAGVAVLYLLLNISIASVLPLEQIQNSKFIVSEFMEHLSGTMAANIVTGLILLVAFASVFSATLGYSRIPYAAAVDGAFFKIFARLHPTKHFPHISLLCLGAIAFLFSILFNLNDVITAILAIRILIQFIGQGIGLFLLVKKYGKKHFAWRMPLYPLPAVLAILFWGYIFFSTGFNMMMGGLTVISLGIIVFLIKSKRNREWPFEIV